MLEKLNSFTYDVTQGLLVKHLLDRNETLAEINALNTLAVLTADSAAAPALRVPKVYPEFCTLYSVSMSHLSGIRLFDLICLLNKIAQTAATPLAQKVFEVKAELLSNSLNSVATFQAEQTQTRLIAGLQAPVSKYDYFDKFIEALDYVAEVYGREVTSKLSDEAAHICGTLSDQASRLFRDASLKNRVLVMPDSQGGMIQDADRDLATGNVRLSERPWTDQLSILRLVEDYGISLVTGHPIYEVDFATTHTLTVPCDDYLHILFAQAAGFSYEYAIDYLATHCAVDECLCNYTLLFRFFREWVRRLFYKHERAVVFGVRYYYETPEYYYQIALDGLERLRRNSQAAGFLDHLHAFMSDLTSQDR